MPNTPAGHVVRDEGEVRLVFDRAYERPVDVVWAALTEPEQVACWFGRWTGDPASGCVELVMTDEGTETPEQLTIRECTPPERLAVTVPGPDGAWSVEVRLVQEGEHTRLRLTHLLVEPYDASGIGPGWHYYLDRLGAVVTGGPVPTDWEDYVGVPYEVPAETPGALP